MAMAFPLSYTPVSVKPVTYSRRSKLVVFSSSSNGRDPSPSEEKSVPNGVKSIEKLQEEKRRAELSARIASGAFTVRKSSFPSTVKNGLSKLGVPSNVLDFMFDWTGANEDYLKVPEAKGSIQAVRNEAFFIPLYELFLTYGGIFRLTFGPKSFLIVSDPSIAKHILKDNAKAYSKGILAEILDFVMGKGLIPADGEIWRRRRRAIVPALHMKNPKVVAKLQEEVDSVIGDRFPTLEDMKKLKYTTRVMNESLRLYPQPPVLIRRSLENDKLGPYPIKRGEDIFISVWNLHRSPLHWDDAEEFNPERWPLDGPNPNETNQNFSYLPFGGGPRKCIGDMFASFENVVAIAMLIRRFNFQTAPGAPPVKMTTGATIHTTEGLKLTVTKRTPPLSVPILPMEAPRDEVSSALS
ncbi:hypothetical protein BRARA_H00705 [Brassica rapa]|uniref:Cytochrome P450 n=1 Tax=Brassica campestris TaxID=3711 RepID=A0A397YDM8_BRACM|nr:hypothetical protein BRARA_H00705 [Brassica rapa]